MGFSNWVRPVSKELMHLLSLCAVLLALLKKSVKLCKIPARSCRRLLLIEEVTNQNLVGGLIANTCL